MATPNDCDISMDRILVAVERTTGHLKGKFPNLTTEEALRLANNILRSVVATFEGK